MTAFDYFFLAVIYIGIGITICSRHHRRRRGSLLAWAVFMVLWLPLYLIDFIYRLTQWVSGNRE